MTARKTLGGLAGSRIYRRRNRFYFFAPEPTINPKTGKVARWHSLCDVKEGEARALQLARAIQSGDASMGSGDFSVHMDSYKKAIIAKRDKRKPSDKARLAIFEAGNADIARQCAVISAAFEDFSVSDVIPVDIARFVDQWEGRRMAQVYRGRLSDFFSWACRKGLRNDNPAREVKVEKPERRKRYITNDEFLAIRAAMEFGDDGRKNLSGAMMQCFLDLLYLTMQRPTEIRLLRWSQVDMLSRSIRFEPTKTEKSSGARVAVPITKAIEEVLERAKAIRDARSPYVIRTLDGEPYGTFGIRSAWQRACRRAKVKGATTRDIRSKAITDALQAGYSMEQLRIAAAHTDEKMTSQYVKQSFMPWSEIHLLLPASANEEANS